MVRSTVRLRGSGDVSGPLDETFIELCRTVYKLHFQLLLLMEGFAKTLSLISVDAQVGAVSPILRGGGGEEGEGF